MPQLKIDENNHLHYSIIQGDVESPCLVFLHEGLGCEAMWKGFPERLCEATGCPGLIYDRLGYGDSSPLPRAHTVHYMHDYALKELPRLLEAVIPGKAFILSTFDRHFIPERLDLLHIFAPLTVTKTRRVKTVRPHCRFNKAIKKNSTTKNCTSWIMKRLGTLSSCPYITSLESYISRIKIGLDVFFYPSIGWQGHK